MAKVKIHNRFIVDGKALKVWIGKRVPKWIKIMSQRYRGCTLEQTEMTS